MIVTIVTVVKNGENSILDTINSINHQTYKDIEHVIIDSVSTDKTLEIVTQNIKNFSIIISEPDDGVYDGINKGILKSTGEIIGVLNADDFYIDEKVIEDVVEEFKKKEINFLYADLYYIDRSDKSKIIRRWISGSFNFGKIEFGWMPPHPTIFFKKSLVENLGLFNLEYRISSDYDFILRYLLSTQVHVGYLPRTITKMRVGGISNRSLINIFKKTFEDYLIIKKNNVGGILTLLLKNVRKIPQIFLR